LDAISSTTGYLFTEFQLREALRSMYSDTTEKEVDEIIQDLQLPGRTCTAAEVVQ
jgi:hypothetical protein